MNSSFAATINNRNDLGTGSHHSKRRSQQWHTILVLAGTISVAYADQMAAPPGSQLRDVDDLPLAGP